MGEILNAFNNFNNTSKQLIVFFIIIGSFWTVAFCLFKPEVFEYPFYVQFALIFALSVCWFLYAFLASSKLLAIIDKNGTYAIGLVSIFSIVLLCVSILISYYFSGSFTFFLRIAFLAVMLPFHIIIVLFSIVLDYRELSRNVSE
ncbi:hypothetical protein [Flavobacterium gelatinilyticum]|uniref:hypothetical protein n=1 Tax=Flavobacterium gelatinilyticum TaxID=3003260 RepID=UPI00247FBABC|nr:hypothetical protein [Flavobacterium gelatinilyticum]